MTDTLVGDGATIEATAGAAAAGDEVAFARLIAEHHPAMARVAYVITGDADATRDAVQSAWTIAWRRLGGLRDPSQVRAWLVAIAANEARQAVRRRRRAPVVDMSPALEQAATGDPADGVGIVDLQRVLRGLKPEDRSLLALRFAAGLDSVEIARHLRLSPSGVRSRLARLLERLRTDLALEADDRPMSNERGSWSSDRGLISAYADTHWSTSIGRDDRRIASASDTLRCCRAFAWAGGGLASCCVLALLAAIVAGRSPREGARSARRTPSRASGTAS
jgi:RNA polymerase sigma-70 factor (ECF subfamily)